MLATTFEHATADGIAIFTHFQILHPALVVSEVTRLLPQCFGDFGLALSLLGNASGDLVARYSGHSRTGWKRMVLGRQHLNWREYYSAEVEALAEALVQGALQYDHTRGLFEAAMSFLRREQIIRPGLTTLGSFFGQMLAVGQVSFLPCRPGVIHLGDFRR